MPEINIPENLNNRLSLNSTWQRVVTTLKEKVQTLIKEGPYFFPDYTDHGIDHINAVLNMADQLISKETYTTKQSGQYLFDSKAVAFLICAILLHDLGMFLKPDGAQELADGAHSSHLVKKLDRNTWKESWSKYVSRTQRLKISEMVRTYGHSVEISEDCIRKGFSTTEDDRRIIGEFLRQNHGRLAHEIAIHGFPGTQSQDLFHEPDCNKKDRDMIGLLARSHQMNIRDTEAYVRTFGKDSMPHGIPAYYLMAVLRMADYLDASEKRAPEILERIQKIRVPSSEQEWTWNQCISKDEKRCDPFTHNLRIDADPEKSTDYVLVDQWLRSVQAELDLCWSILAEHYSDKPFRLTIHRVISRIHEEDVLERFNEEFLPREVKITANPEIVKLMMEPLYGDDPTYGVRELLQNAVDACLEREQWEKTHKEGDPNYKGLVDIRIENDVFTITDNGMGMNEDILLNYYLSAGSSYRSSDAWMAANAPDGKSQVARTGKFGVGFLASFLLGDEVEVHTQHREDKKGYQFKFDQKSIPLDIERADRINPYAAEVSDPTHAGTTITIKLKATAIRGFNSNNYNYPWYNWYVFDEPKVRYFINRTELKHRKFLLHRPPAETPGWLELTTENYESIMWSPNLYGNPPEFYCNGFRIYDGFPITPLESRLETDPPHVSMIDRNSLVDVTLSRQKLKSFPGEVSLYKAVYRWYIARLLLTPWNTEKNYRQNLTRGFFLQETKFWTLRFPFLLSHGGFSLNNVSVPDHLCIEEYVILYYAGPRLQNATQIVQSFLQNIPYVIVPSNASPNDFASDLLTRLGGRLLKSQMQMELMPHASHCINTVWLRTDIYSSTPDLIQTLVLSESVINKDITIAYHQDRRSDMPINRDFFSIDTFPVVAHITLDHGNSDTHDSFIPDSLFDQTLREILTPAPDYPDQSLWIPFDMEERKKKFPKAFEELEYYMDHIHKYPVE